MNVILPMLPSMVVLRVRAEMTGHSKRAKKCSQVREPCLPAPRPDRVGAHIMTLSAPSQALKRQEAPPLLPILAGRSAVTE